MRKTWWMTITPSPCSVPTRTASPLLDASRSDHAIERARSSFTSR